MKIKKQFIGGKWVNAISNQTRDIINPFNQEVIARVVESTEADTIEAIKSARQAFDHGDWPTIQQLNVEK